LGYYSEGDPALSYVRSRWLRPTTGSWLSVDPVEGEPRYLYVNGSPVNGTDGSGELLGRLPLVPAVVKKLLRGAFMVPVPWVARIMAATATPVAPPWSDMTGPGGGPEGYPLCWEFCKEVRRRCWARYGDKPSPERRRHCDDPYGRCKSRCDWNSTMQPKLPCQPWCDEHAECKCPEYDSPTWEELWPGYRDEPWW
jgi:RHS repeat-associated protein